MNFTLHQLEIFCKVVEKKSITKAAEELFLTQPAVSIQIKQLQEQFDIPLTEIISKKVYITEFGNEIANIAQKILFEVEEIKNKTIEYSGHLSGTLNFSIVSTAKYIMPYFLKDFVNQYPEVKIQVDVTNKTKVIEDLVDNNLDFGMVSVLPQNIALNSFPLMDNSLYLIGHKNSEIKRINDWGRFNKLSMIYREVGSATRTTMEKFMKENNIPIKLKMELASNESVKQALLAELGYSIMPIIGLKNELESGELRILPAKGLPLHTQWQFIYLQNKRLSPVANAFLDYLKTNTKTIIKEHFDWLEKY